MLLLVLVFSHDVLREMPSASFKQTTLILRSKSFSLAKVMYFLLTLVKALNTEVGFCGVAFF